MSLFELCVRRPVFTTMLVMSLVVLGIFSFRDLGVDLFPKNDAATITITIPLPGASPDEIETSVIEPMESVLSSLSGMDELTARATEGSARITCKFVLGRDINEEAQNVREKVAVGMKLLPPQVQPPIIVKVDPDASPVITLVVSGPGMTLRTITEVADKLIKRALEAVDGVGQVTLSGTRQREIHLTLDVEKLTSYGLTIDQVRSAVQAENVEIPGGRLEQGKSQLLLRTLGRVEAADQFGTIVIATIGGTPIKISDVGRVEDTTETPQTGAWLDGKEAVVLDVQRQSGENTLQVIEAVKRKLRQIGPTLPRSMNLVVTRDDSRFINASIASLEEHLFWGSILASLVVMFFIRNWRAVLISSLAIPASIIATFTLMRVMGFTLNNMTLLGLTLAVGIVIDDAIVVLENVFRFIEEKGYRPFDAAIAATREVSLAVLATTISLVVIFLPVAFMNGYARQFINPFGWTMAFAIMVSLLVSFTLTPMLSARWLKTSGDADKTKQTPLFLWIDRAYTRSLRWAMAHRWAVVGLSALVLASTVPLNRMVGRSFIPNEDASTFQVVVDGSEGTSLDGMSEAVLGFSRELSQIPGVAHIIPTINERVNHSHLLFQLDDPDRRTMTQDQIMSEARRIMTSHLSYRPTAYAPTAIGGGENASFPVQVQLTGPDIERLADYALRLLQMTQGMASVADPKANLSFANPEVHVAVDRQRAADLDVRIGNLAQALRLMVSGDDEISTYREGTERYPVKMRVLESQRRDVQSIRTLMVPSGRLGTVRVDNVAQVERGVGPSTIERFNRQFAVALRADLRPGHALDEATGDIRRAIGTLGLAPGYGFRFTGQSQILDETTGNLILAIALGSIFMYMVLCAQFESFLQPIVIMLVLPLSIPFALLTLWATGRTLNLWSALGILLLLGIVKKNSILQVDYANVLRSGGMEASEAIVEASRTRLRPILMTTAAILAGLVPTALGIGIGGAQRSAIAVTIIGGQSLCLFLTLLLVPVAYTLLDSLEKSLLLSRTWKRPQWIDWAYVTRRPSR
jgi:HAE1 family hydrophobic/amphiphilic exporter-1